MDTTDLSDIPAVRLASGIEMQQKWPSLVHTNDQQKPTGKEAPRLLELAPTRGSQGTVVTVVVQSLPYQIIPVKLAFNNLVVDTKQMQAQGITSLVAAVPPFHLTHSASPNVPISICMLDKDSVTETWPVAEFVYELDTKENGATSTTSSTSISNMIDYDNNNNNNIINNKVARNLSSYQQQPQSQQRQENFLGGTSSASSYNNSYEQPTANYNQYNSYYSNRDVYSGSKYNQYRPTNPSPPNQQSINPLNYNSNANSMNLFTPTATGFTSMLNELEQNEPALSSALSSTSADYSQQSTTIGPQHQPVSTTSVYSYNKPSVHVPPTSVANYQPYPGLVSRTNLKIIGDLDSMAKNWTTEEWEHGRRLVQFWRETNGNEIRCTFGTVAPGERISTNSGHIVVSCIYWAGRNDCFITSVDCIHLLESLMDIKFSVEEKNRVRRNLEGFRPLTVSKCKAESADFFKLIMSFPNPKPRNIEKDVKVFPWKTLPYALKKIITKYTASSYSSNNNTSAQHQRRAQLKSVDTTPIATPSSSSTISYMSANQQQLDNDVNFYAHQSNIYSAPSSSPQHQPSSQFAYQQTQPQQHQEAASSLYQSPPSSVPAFSSSAYTQSPPVIDFKDTPSPRMQYSYSDMLSTNRNSSANGLISSANVMTPPPSSSSSLSSPSLNRRTSLDINQPNHLVNFKN